MLLWVNHRSKGNPELALESAPDRRRADAHRLFHHHETRALKTPDDALCDDRRHEFIRVVHALATLKSQVKLRFDTKDEAIANAERILFRQFSAEPRRSLVALKRWMKTRLVKSGSAP